MSKMDMPPFDVGKLKHDRILKVTAMALTFGGSVLAGIVFNENIKLPMPKDLAITMLVAGMVLFLTFQNFRLNKLEEVLGWDERLEEGKMIPLAKEIDKSIKKIADLIKLKG